MATHRNALTLGLALGISAATAGCTRSSSAGSAPPMSALAIASGAAVVVRPAPETRALKVPGFLSAVLVVPDGNDARPLVVAAHGAGGAPEWECDYWTRLTSGRAFVLCPRGTRISPGAGFYFRDHRALDAELEAVVAAARRAFPRIMLGSGMFAGFSQGASMGSLVVAKRAEEFPYVVLIEGFQPWNGRLARGFARHGGKSVLFACGSRQCANLAGASRRALERAGLRCHVEHAPGAGHTPINQVEALVAANLAWLLADDAAWAK